MQSSVYLRSFKKTLCTCKNADKYCSFCWPLSFGEEKYFRTITITTMLKYVSTMGTVPSSLAPMNMKPKTTPTMATKTITHLVWLKRFLLLITPTKKLLRYPLGKVLQYCQVIPLLPPLPTIQRLLIIK